MIQGIIGILMGAAIFLPVGISLGLSDAHHPMIKNCEAELPRNEHCILIAVPEKGE
jgi:hypothetical protein